MSEILGNLKPQAVFHYFEQMTKIPRESGNEAAISEYLVNFAKEHNLDYVQEPCKNVIITKPATPGYEDAPRVILQGHMDMVCVKDDELDFNFETDALPIYVDGDWLRTKGTTLGADNGIAVAMSLAILADETLEHPALTVLVTTEEETGMDGVMALDPSNVPGDILINIDSEEEGVALASCAGGVRNSLKLPIEWTEVDAAGLTSYEIVISGLKGGHSGIEINKCRANANKLMGRLLHYIQDLNVSVSSIAGGEKMNAISKRAILNITLAQEQSEALESKVKDFEIMVRAEFETADPGISVVTTKKDTVTKVFTKETSQNLMYILQLIPYGPQTMSANIPGLVESSSNIGVVEMDENEIEFNSAIRSSVSSLKREINHRIQAIANLTGATMELIADYPEWEFETESKVREIMKDVYQEMFGKELEVSAIHAGLECGFLSQKLGKIDMISIGPDITGAHTPKESLSIPSTERVYNFLCDVLKAIK
ncbi:aminoacyl-histidine dipeptidase [Turicibacter bilis]|uniref:aminoacyl-histidine dipeptidase n=1 Tax=Turicibacter bilis TaxID=2735723 RepID=UPI0031B9E74F